MQDRYVGDVGDYGKYGLLQKLIDESKGKITLGVNWFYVTREENDNGDGNHLGYLTKENESRDRYRACFPDLYDKLGRIIQGSRAVSDIEKNQVLPKSTIFFSKPIPYASATATGRREERKSWLDESLSELNEADILFLDPDNGIQVDTSKKSYPNAIKYVYPDEIERYYRLGKSVIIYNHRDRRPRTEYDQKILCNKKYVKSLDNIRVLRFKRVSVRDYIILIQEHHRDLIYRTIASLTKEPFNFLYEQYYITEGHVMAKQDTYWTNPSVIALAGSSEPVDFITKKARDVTLSAIDSGWKGPPYDPFKLADLLKISTVPNEGLFEARTVPVGSHHFRIEYNPNKPHGRTRFSVAHELAHTLFPDCRDTVRSRSNRETWRDDDWQLELLCNIAAAELLMPLGTGMELEQEEATIDNILMLRKRYHVSTEAMSLRLLNLTHEPCTLFTAARITDGKQTSYRVDYSVASRSSNLNITRGLKIPSKTVLSECVAIGYTAKGTEHWGSGLPEMNIECVGIPPYPNQQWPRIVGIARGSISGERESTRIKYLLGDALDPRGEGNRIIAHIVNDKTPNWGAGFPLELKRKWPSVQQNFKEWAAYDNSRLSLGEVNISPIKDDLNIVHMIAQHGYGHSSKPRIRYKALKECLEKLTEIAINKNARVHMPRIGTGQAGGNWLVIADLIDESLVRRKVDVTVYDLPGSDPLAPEQVPFYFLPRS